jgi:outer membrane protein assembly factor BamE (lipoprotein component of BamABCDE complex)
MTKLNIRSKVMGLSLATALATSLGGCLGYDGDVYRGYVVDEKAMSQVKMGSSAEQTLVVLGTPSTTSTVGGDAWYYISQKTERKLAFMQPSVTDQRIFAVYFDKNKKVQRIANYGLEDGKVVNFIDRTTPTAGGETSFLKNMMQNLLRFS